jgi:hypothetical protein
LIELVQYIANVLMSRNIFSSYLTLSFLDFLVTRMAVEPLLKVAVQHFLLHEDVPTIQAEPEDQMHEET